MVGESIYRTRWAFVLGLGALLMAGSCGSDSTAPGPSQAAPAWQVTQSGERFYGIGEARRMTYSRSAAEGTSGHFNGKAWTLMDGGTARDLYGVWGSSNSNVMQSEKAASFFTMMERAGASRQADSREPCLDTGSSESDIFAVGAGGAIVHYGAGGWSLMDSITAVVLSSVWQWSE